MTDQIDASVAPPILTNCSLLFNDNLRILFGMSNGIKSPLNRIVLSDEGKTILDEAFNVIYSRKMGQ